MLISRPLLGRRGAVRVTGSRAFDTAPGEVALSACKRAAPLPAVTTSANMAALATLVSQAEVLDTIFAGLKDKNHEIRLQSAIELQRYVRTRLLSRASARLTRCPRYRTQYQICCQIWQPNYGTRPLAGSPSSCTARQT